MITAQAMVRNALCCVLILSLSAQASIQEEVSIGLDHLFVPKGFDSNDNVEVIVSGYLPNTCHVRPYGDVSFDGEEITVGMKATRISGADTHCIEALVPYLVSVPLGQLREGTYNIRVNLGSASEHTKALGVDRPNSNSINNFTYANVTTVKASQGSSKIRIAGVHPSSCMTIDHVEVIANEEQDTFAILPIVKQVQPICDRMIKPFEYDFEIPNSSTKDQLLHVRKIDGTAINHMVSHDKR